MGEEKVCPFSAGETPEDTGHTWISQARTSSHGHPQLPGTLDMKSSGYEVFWVPCAQLKTGLLFLQMKGRNTYCRMASSLCHFIIFDYPQKEHFTGYRFDFGCH